MSLIISLAVGIVASIAVISWRPALRRLTAILLGVMWLPFAGLYAAAEISSDGVVSVAVSILQFAATCLVGSAVFRLSDRPHRKRAEIA